MIQSSGFRAYSTVTADPTIYNCLELTEDVNGPEHLEY